MDERFKRENIKPDAHKGRMWNDEFVIRINNISEESDVFKMLWENDACKRIVMDNGYIMLGHGRMFQGRDLENQIIIQLWECILRF